MTTKIDTSSDGLYDDSLVAYEHHCVVHGYGYSQPSRMLSEVDHDRVLLQNVNGPLAQFIVSDGELILVEIGEEDSPNHSNGSDQ